MEIEPATRRANFWLFVGLVAFAIVLCAVVLWWMRVRTHAQGGKVYPPVSAALLFCHPERSAAESKDRTMKYSVLFLTSGQVQNSPVEMMPTFPLIS